jgi:hypothetical protein
MSKLLIKRSAVAAKVPATTDLDLGELGVNTYDGKVYMKKNDGTESIVEVSAVAHKADTANPHSVTKAQVGLGSVDNTSDADKPVSTATQTALDGKVDDAQVQTDVPADALFTDTVYTHPTGAGNNHIPSGGSTGQFLKWSSSGVAVWAADNNTVYTHPTTSGNKHIPSGGLALQILKYSSDGTAYWANETNTWRGIDDVPVDGQTAESISSNWAFDHAASSKHIPSGGTVGQILVNTGSGTAAWSAGVAPVKNRFTATASQTVFTLTSTSDGLDANTEVFVNGVLMELTDDYALTNATTITMAAPLPAGHKVMIKYST